MVKENKQRRVTNAFRGIIGGALSLTVSNLAVKVLGLIYKIPLSYLLGDMGMGYFNSAYTIFGLFYLLCTAGVPKGLMILCSEMMATGEERVWGTVKSAMRAFLFIALGFSSFLLVFAFPFARLIGNSGAAFTIISIAPSIIFVALSGVLRGYLSARSSFLDIAVSGVIEGTAKLVLGLALAIFAIKMQFSLEIVSALTILGATFGALLGFIYLLKSAKSSEKPRQNVSRKENSAILKRIFKISLPITLGAAVTSLGGIIDLGLVMRRLSRIGFSESIASSLYGNYTTLAVPMFNFAQSLIMPISVIFLPRLTVAHTQKNISEYNGLLNSFFNITSFISAPLTFGFAVYAEEILSLIFGHSSAAVGAGLLSVLSPGIALCALTVVVNTALESEGNFMAPICAMLAGAIVKIISGHFMIGNPELGIFGAPFGTVLSYATALLISHIYFSKKSLAKMSILKSVLPYYIFAFVAVVLSRGVYSWLDNGAFSVVSLFVSITVCALIYLTFSVFFVKKFRGDILLLSKYTKSVGKI